VIYNLTASLQPGQLRLVVARLGAGNDSFIANLFNQGSGVGSDVLANASLVISGHGGEGNDILRVNAQHDVDVAIGSALAILMGGDSGQDQIIAEYRGENAGSVAFNQLDGGTGNDSILGSLREDVGSTGISSASVQGDDGDDALGLYMWTEHPPLQALLDGGAGVDTAGHTANVTVVNVP
ncbi:MAG TPA: hypothetical protein VHR66_23505, partial [Gemmataceae bacterium]|nr:hypothetical protein [Gemmataceae bacterium]